MITLVLGGARSGKSALAERLAAERAGPVTYVATATVTDDDMAARIAVHRARRPSEWSTVEAGRDLVRALRGAAGTALVDSLGAWVAATPGLEVDADALAHTLEGRSGDTVVVSEEVGLSVHPESDIGRRFVDVLGTVNQRVAALADEVVLVVAGRAVRLA